MNGKSKQQELLSVTPFFSLLEANASGGKGDLNSATFGMTGGVSSLQSVTEYQDIDGKDLVPIQDTPIYKLLKAFKLEQYAKMMQEHGFSVEIYKLVLLNDDQINRFQVLPQHSQRFAEMFTFVHQLWSKEEAMAEIKQGTPLEQTKGGKI